MIESTRFRIFTRHVRGLELPHDRSKPRAVHTLSTLVRIGSERASVEVIGQQNRSAEVAGLLQGLTGIYPGRHLAADKKNAPSLGTHFNSTIARASLQSPTDSL